nr:MAG: type I phosphodiesterase / nucleotide pyrophosphatase [Candidatus Nanosalinarum sp. J07AB56]
MEFDKILVVGLDGLDHQKIQEYRCENLMQDSFGKLELDGIQLSTPMLWSSFMTGEKPESHGIDKMLAAKGEKARRFDNTALKLFNLLGMSGLHVRKTLIYYLYSSSMVPMTRDDLEAEPLFEEVADAEVLTMPGYTDYPYIAGKMNVGPVLSRDNPPASRERVFRDMRAEFEHRRKRLFEHMSDHTFLMQHFHYPDWFQHLFFNGSRDKEMYTEMNELAGDILEEAGDDTLVVFLSDHGLEGGGHRDEAFYSANAQIGEDVTITNLMDRCLHQLSYAKSEEVDVEV